MTDKRNEPSIKHMNKNEGYRTTLIVAVIITLILLLLPLCKFIRIAIHSDYLAYYSLVIAFLTLIATVSVAYLIYKDQQRIEKDRNDEEVLIVKNLMCSEIESALMHLIIPTEEYKSKLIGKNIKDLFIHYSSVLSVCLDQELFNHLQMLANFIDAYSNCNSLDKQLELEYEGFNGFIRNWVRTLLHSKYREYATLAFDYKDMLAKRTIELLKALKYPEMKYNSSLNDIYSELSGNVYSYNQSTKEYTVMVGEELIMQGTLQFDSLQGLYTICNGYDKGYLYDGHYRNGKFDGAGCCFNGRSAKSKEGEWKQGTLIDGKIYDNLFLKVRITDDASYGNAYDVLDNLASVNPIVNNSNKEYFYVADLIIKDGKTKEIVNQRSLIDFMEKEYRNYIM